MSPKEMSGFSRRKESREGDAWYPIPSLLSAVQHEEMYFSKDLEPLGALWVRGALSAWPQVRLGAATLMMSLPTTSRRETEMIMFKGGAKSNYFHSRLLPEIMN